MELLVQRYVGLVYAAARRHMGDRADDIVQAVWMVTARRAGKGQLPREAYMAGWLLKVTGYVAKEARRAAIRRNYHEHRAAGKRSELQAGHDAGTGEILQVVDGALLGLGALDREVVARRYLQGQEVRDVALAVGMTEDSARRRIARALEKLRKLLARRGVQAPVAIIGAALASQAVLKAPVGWAAIGAAGNQTIVRLAQATLWRMTMVKVQMIAVVAVAAAGIGAVMAHAVMTQATATAPARPTPSVEAFAGDSPVKNGLRTQITADTNSFAAGQPIPMKLEVANVGTQTRHYDQHVVTLNRGLVVRDENGQPVPYLGGTAQIMAGLERMDPGQKKQIEAFDLGSVYYLRRPGKYTVSFPGAPEFAMLRPVPEGGEAADDGLPASNTFQFEITGTGPADGDPAGKLLPLEHGTWKLVGNPNGTGKLRPGSNWSEVTGRRFIFEDTPTHLIRDVATITVWLCDDAAGQTAPAGEATEPKTEYAGKIGRWHVYLAIWSEAGRRWPTAAEEIKKALSAEQR
jgi:RNA polymerase sigma factor (sigma-70 family)